MRHVERFRDYWCSLISEQKLARSIELRGSIIAYFPEIPISTFNHVANIGVDEDELEDLLIDLSEFFTSKEINFVSIRVDPSNLTKKFSSILEAKGFRQENAQSVMVFKGATLEVKINREIKIKQISESEINIFNQILLRIFDMPPEWKEGFDKLTLDRIRNGVRFYFAYQDDCIVGICGLFSSKKTGEIFAVGTLEEYRGIGIATTMVFYAIKDSIKIGNDLHTLRTDVDGYPERLYKKMGFEIDHTTSFYVKK